jgi:hypothetical protein
MLLVAPDSLSSATSAVVASVSPTTGVGSVILYLNTPLSYSAFSQGLTAYDPLRNVWSWVVTVGGVQTVQSFDLASNASAPTSATLPGSSIYDIHASSATGSLLVLASASEGESVLWELAGTTWTKRVVFPAGYYPAPLGACLLPSSSPTGEVIVALDGPTGQTVFFLDASWTVTANATISIVAQVGIIRLLNCP